MLEVLALPGLSGSPTGFARGGMVPALVIATLFNMLTPGEFVIRKSSVKLGAGTLAAMNENKFNRGARIKKELDYSKEALRHLILRRVKLYKLAKVALELLKQLCLNKRSYLPMPTIIKLCF